SIRALLPASDSRSAAASWTRIDRLAGGGFVRIDRDELEVAVVVEFELSERRQLADLTARIVQRERAVERLELSVEAENRAAQFKLVEAGRNRKRFLEDQAGGVTGNGIETELDLAVGIFLVPGRLVVLHVHAEIDRIVQFRGRHVGEDVLKALSADVLFQQLGFEAWIDAEQHFELGADILHVP